MSICFQLAGNSRGRYVEINIEMMCQRSVNVCKQIGKKNEQKNLRPKIMNKFEADFA